MKKLLILSFCLYQLPAHAYKLPIVVCTNHVERVTHVYTNVKVSKRIKQMPYGKANDLVCEKIKQINERG